MTSSWLMGLVGLLYCGTAGMLIIEHQPYKALIFTGYALAQIGFILDH